MSIYSPNTILPDPVFQTNPDQEFMSQTRRISIKKRDKDSITFGFDIKKLTMAESKKATNLLTKEFSKEVGPLGKRKERLQQQKQEQLARFSPDLEKEST
jgi:hypothetical protein